MLVQKLLNTSKSRRMNYDYRNNNYGDLKFVDPATGEILDKHIYYKK